MNKVYSGSERRKFLRLDYIAPLAFKICKKKTVSSLLAGYTSDVSQEGLRCKIKEKIKKGDIVWLAFDRATLNICKDLEKKALIYQKGVVGRVVWVEPKGKTMYEAGVRFVTRQEKNLANIYSKTGFLEQGDTLLAEDEQEEEAAIEIQEPLEEGLTEEE